MAFWKERSVYVQARERERGASASCSLARKDQLASLPNNPDALQGVEQHKLELTGLRCSRSWILFFSHSFPFFPPTNPVAISKINKINLNRKSDSFFSRLDNVNSFMEPSDSTGSCYSPPNVYITAAGHAALFSRPFLILCVLRSMIPSISHARWRTNHPGPAIRRSRRHAPKKLTQCPSC